MEKKLYQSLLLAIASGGITTEDAKELLNTLLPTIFTGLCTEYEITENDPRYDDTILLLRTTADMALDYFVDYQPEPIKKYKIMFYHECSDPGYEEYDGVIYKDFETANDVMNDVKRTFGYDCYLKVV